MDQSADAASPQEQLRHDLLTAATVLRGTTQLLQRQLARQDGMADAERAVMQARLRVLAMTTDRIVQLARDLDRQPPT
jgi:signal transduction histidine kinase